MGQKEMMEIQESPGKTENQDQLENLEIMDSKVLRENQDNLVRMVLMVDKATLANLAPTVHRDHRDLRDPLEMMETRANPVIVFQETRETRGHKDYQVTLVLMGSLAMMVGQGV